VEDGSIAFLEFLGNLHIQTSRCEIFPIEAVSNFLIRRKSEILHASMNFSIVVGQLKKTINQRSNKFEFFFAEKLWLCEIDVSQGLINLKVKLVASVIVDGCIEFLVFENRRAGLLSDYPLGLSSKLLHLLVDDEICYREGSIYL
jgi:hypothetical protein